MKPLKILYLEDSAQDAELAGYTLKKAGIDFAFKLVDSQDEYQEALRDYKPDIVLADHSLYHFNSLQALKLFKDTGLKIPFILVTGTVSEEFAVNILKQGADDYLLKDNLARLPNAILNSLEKYHIDRERQLYLESIVTNQALMKEAEQVAQFGSWEADVITGEIKWSDGIFRIYGYEPGEIKPGHDVILRHIHPDDRTIYQQAMASGPEQPGTFASEVRVTDELGYEKFIYFKIVVRRDANGQLSRFLGFMQDVTEKRKLEKELDEQALGQQKLITEVTIQAQEKERNELGRELHDNINQLLATVKMFLVMSKDNPAKRDELISRSATNIDYAIEEIRKLSRTLVSPSLGDIGLITALEQLVEEINLGNELKVELTASITTAKKPDKNYELMVYRIVQEQLTNIRKYAKAKRVVIILTTEEDRLFFSIHDDGIGFDVTKKVQGIGLRNIRGRVNFYSGQMEIITAPGQGCTLNIVIPF